MSPSLQATSGTHFLVRPQKTWSGSHWDIYFLLNASRLTKCYLKACFALGTFLKVQCVFLLKLDLSIFRQEVSCRKWGSFDEQLDMLVKKHSLSLGVLLFCWRKNAIFNLFFFTGNNPRWGSSHGCCRSWSKSNLNFHFYLKHFALPLIVTWINQMSSCFKPKAD